jgi:glycosyltransferase involved in cell wall biosynthesis
MKLRATVVADVPTHFQNVLFDAVAARGEVDLEVWFCRKSVVSRVSTGEGPRRARFRMLPHIPIGASGLNPMLLPRLARARDGVTFVIGYYLPGLASACVALGCTSRPWVFWTDTLPVTPSNGSGRRVARDALLAWCLRRSTLCLTTGDTGRRSILEHGVVPERVCALPFVVDQERLAQASDDARTRRDALRAGLGIRADERVALFIGQMFDGKGTAKGLDILLRAHASCARNNGGAPRLVVVGDGPDREGFERLAAELGAQPPPMFLGALPYERLPEMFAVANALVLPSRFDAWPVVVIEALAAGLPVVGSDACGSVRDAVVEGEGGWIVPAGDEDALLRALERLCRVDAARLKTMQARARASVALWSADAAAKGFTDVVESAYRMRRGG